MPFVKGTKQTEELKRKLSALYSGKHVSPNTEFKKGHIGYKSHLGKKFSENSRKKMSEAKLGTHQSEATRNKRSQAMKGKGTWMKGRHNSPQTEFKKGQIIDEETRRKIKEFQNSPIQKERFRKLRLTWILPKRDTSIERKMQDELASREIGFYKHIPVCEICQPDIVFLDKKIAIFCDGCYWHKCSECGFGNGKKRDNEINEQLRSEGWLVLRYWEHEINDNVEGVVDEIEEYITKKW